MPSDFGELSRDAALHAGCVAVWYIPRQMHADIDRILISHERIAQRVGQLAAQITADHTPDKLNGGEVTILPIMTGAMIFCAS